MVYVRSNESDNLLIQKREKHSINDLHNNKLVYRSYMAFDPHTRTGSDTKRRPRRAQKKGRGSSLEFLYVIICHHHHHI